MPYHWAIEVPVQVDPAHLGALLRRSWFEGKLKQQKQKTKHLLWGRGKGAPQSHFLSGWPNKAGPNCSPLKWPCQTPKVTKLVRFRNSIQSERAPNGRLSVSPKETAPGRPKQLPCGRCTSSSPPCQCLRKGKKRKLMLTPYFSQAQFISMRGGEA